MDAGLDVRALGRWLEGAQLGDGLPEVRRLGGGSQNELYTIRTGAGEDLVLRMPPATAGADRRQAFAREARVLAALRGSDVPHPELMGSSDDPTILGAPFLLMRRIEGWSVMQTGGWPAAFADSAGRGELARELVRGAAAMARLDWRGAGLEGFGRPDGFHERQVDRWLDFLSRIAFRDIPHVTETAEWLRTHRPPSFVPGLMHGDYSFANVMFGHGRPGRLAAIVDWEMATVGDPLLDLAWALNAWPPEGSDVLAKPPGDLEDMPPLDQLVEEYAQLTGRDIGDFRYYLVLGRFKLAIVLEASAARHARGEADERVAGFGESVLNLMDKAAELARAGAEGRGR